MKRFKYIAMVLGGVVFGGSLAAAPPSTSPGRAKPPAVSSSKPNIVHIMVDDLGWQDIASHKVDGKPVYETPNLDRLTRMGRRFTQAYSPAPTCAPSRAAFLRGQYPARTGVYHVMGGRVPRRYVEDINYIPPYYRYGLPKDEPTIPEVLKQAGYVSGHVGKWHLGGKSAGYPFPLDQGFDFGFSEKGGRQKFYNDSNLWGPQGANKNQFFGSWASMKPDRLSDFATGNPDDPYQLDQDGRPFDKPLDLALGFIRNNREQPFFLNFCTYLVHGPIGTRDRARLELYCKKMGYAFPTDPGTINEGKKGQTNPYYASMVDSMDWMVGKVLTYLEQTDDPRNPGHNLIDNTYVIVDSDNGGWVGSPGRPITDNSPLRGGKQQTYEGGIRIPFLVRGPGIPAGTTCDTPINLVDLFPTFMDMAGLEPDQALKLDGCNLFPLMKGTSDRAITRDGNEREAIYWYFPFESHMSFAMRKDDWKLVRNFGVHGGGTRAGNVELYRLYHEDGSVNDLGEQEDLSKKHPERRDAMLAELNTFIASAGAPLPYRNLKGKFATDEERAASPAILELGSKEDQVWATFESGDGKVGMLNAKLLYTLNPKPFDSTRGHREEWMPHPARISKGRVEAAMPPGATHAAFCMVDANGFLVTSEPMPAFQDKNHTHQDSGLLENGFAYKPGLFALIALGQRAQKSAGKAEQDVTALKEALHGAKKAYRTADAAEEVHCDAIRSLRAAIRDLKGTPQAEHPLINRFPTDPLF